MPSSWRTQRENQLRCELAPTEISKLAGGDTEEDGGRDGDDSLSGDSAEVCGASSHENKHRHKPGKDRHRMLLIISLFHSHKISDTGDVSDLPPLLSA